MGYDAHDTESEKLLLAMIMRGGNDEYDFVRERVCRDDFRIEAHRRIFQAMEDSRHALGVFFFQNVLIENGELEAVGGPIYLGEITDALDRRTNTEWLCGRVVALAAERKERTLYALAATGKRQTI